MVLKNNWLYAGNSGVSSVTVVDYYWTLRPPWLELMIHSNKTSRADNQQERLRELAWWVVGFVDGEGSFSIGFVKQPDRQESTRIRKGYRTGYQVDHTFAVVQGEKSLESLQKIQKFFGLGHIYLNRRHDNHREHLYVYSVSRRKDLIEIIIPFFETHTLRTAKVNDFRKFATCVRMMHRGEHLNRDGLIQIAQIASTMNRRKPRKHLIRILRDYTPISSSGEEKI